MSRNRSRCSIGCIVVALLAGAPSFALAAEATSPIAVISEQRRIDEIRVEGNQRVEVEAIRVQLRAQPGLPLDPKTVDADVRNLYAMGFFDDVHADFTEEGGRGILTYVVVERPLIRDVKIEGNDAISREDLDAALKTRPNTVLDPPKIRRGIDEAKKLYEKKADLDAKIEYVTTPVAEGEVSLTYKIQEGERIRISDIVFEGAREIAPSTLKRVMQTKEGWFLSFVTGAGNLDREVLKTDVERLTAFYYDNGYIDVRIDEPVVTRNEDGLTVTIKIDEGDVFTTGEVRIGGDVLDDSDEFTQELKMKQGEIFRAGHLREDIAFLTDKYGDRGYAFVNVTPDTDIHPADKTVDITYMVSKGPEVYFDRIEISGNTKTRDKVIRRELRVQEQQRFSGTNLRRSQERLRRLGFFEDVNLTTRRGGDESKLNLLVDVKEGPTGSFAAGAGISSGESFLFNVRLSELNLFGRGQRVVLNADIGSIRRNFSLSFTEPYFLDTEVTLGLEAFSWELQFDEFTRSGTGGAVRALYPLPALGYPSIWGFSLDDTRIGLEYRIEEAEISDVALTAATVIRAEQGRSLTSSIIPRIYRDTRNHPFDPTAGSMQDVLFEFAGLGGSSRFYKAEARGRWYFPFYKSENWGVFVLGLGGSVGYGRQYSKPSDELPLFERYFPGGINSNRGYEIRTLGPRVPVFNSRGQLVQEDPIGGSEELITNTEIIFPIVESLGLRGVVFFDAGNAFTIRQGMDVNDLRLSYGAGIRWLSPIGPLRIEVGIPINRRDGDNSRNINFSFGAPP